MTPEQLQSLREALPPFGDDVGSVDDIDAFCRFYGISFSGAREHVEHLAGYVESGPYRLAVHHWRQPFAVANLFIVHGYYDHTGLFSKLVCWGVEQNCNVLIFDLPGHGLSSGPPAVIDDFAEYAQAIDDVLAAAQLADLPCVTMAQSTGCAALMEYARRGNWPFQAGVFLAPLVRPAGWHAVRLANFLLRPLIKSIPRKFADNTGDRDFLRFVQRDPLQCHDVPLAWVSALGRWLQRFDERDLGVGPVLIIQGDKDHTVDWRYNVGVVQTLFPGSEVEYLPGAGHQLANETREVRDRYLAAAARYLARAGIHLGDRTQS